MANKGIVLLVDDEKTIIDVYAPVLKHDGYDVVTRLSFEEATRDIREGLEYDLLITDGSCTITQGPVEHLVIAASREIHPNTPVISMSGYGVQPEGSEIHLLKPVNIDQFLRTVRAHMPNL